MLDLSTLDWVIILILGYFSIKSVNKNLFTQIISIIGWLATYYTVPNYHKIISDDYWFNFLSNEYKELAYKIAIFFITIIIFNFLNTLIEMVFSNTKNIPLLERMLSMIIGLIKGCIFINFMSYVLDHESINIQEYYSTLLPTIQQISQVIQDKLNDIFVNIGIL